MVFFWPFSDTCLTFFFSLCELIVTFLDLIFVSRDLHQDLTTQHKEGSFINWLILKAHQPVYGWFKPSG